MSKYKTFPYFVYKGVRVIWNNQLVNPETLVAWVSCMHPCMSSCWMLHQGNLQTWWNVPFAKLWSRQNQCEVDDDLRGRQEKNCMTHVIQRDFLLKTECSFWNWCPNLLQPHGCPLFFKTYMKLYQENLCQLKFRCLFPRKPWRLDTIRWKGPIF